MSSILSKYTKISNADKFSPLNIRDYPQKQEIQENQKKLQKMQSTTSRTPIGQVSPVMNKKKFNQTFSKMPSHDRNFDRTLTIYAKQNPLNMDADIDRKMRVHSGFVAEKLRSLNLSKLSGGLNTMRSGSGLGKPVKTEASEGVMAKQSTVFLPNLQRGTSTVRSSKSPSWGLSFNNVTVSPQRMRRALGEYRKSTFNNDYIDPFMPTQQGSFVLNEEIKSSVGHQEKSIKIVNEEDRAFRLNETIDSSAGPRNIVNASHSQIDFNIHSNKIFIKKIANQTAKRGFERETRNFPSDISDELANQDLGNEGPNHLVTPSAASGSTFGKRRSLPSSRLKLGNESPHNLMPMKISNPDMKSLRLYQLALAPKLDSVAKRQRSVATRKVLENRIWPNSRDFVPMQSTINATSRTVLHKNFLQRTFQIENMRKTQLAEASKNINQSSKLDFNHQENSNEFGFENQEFVFPDIQ